MRTLAALAAALAVVGPSATPRYVVETLAGSRYGHADGRGAEAQFRAPEGIAVDGQGFVYVTEYHNHTVRKIAPDGSVSTLAGRAQTAGAVDGPARDSLLRHPHGAAVGDDFTVYVSDMMNHAIRKVDLKAGTVTTVAGTGQAGYSGDGGPAAKAQLKQPHSLQFGADGALLICDIGNHAIRRVDPRTGAISTFAGTGKAGATPDGAPIAGTPLNGPRSLDVDAAGDLWLATREGNQVFRFDLKAGVIRHVAGTGKKGFGGNGGPAKEATLSGPKGIAVAPNGDVYLVDTESHSIRKIDAKTGKLVLVIGTGEKGDGPDGPPLACKLARPHGVWVDPDGAVYVGDSENHRVRVLRP